MNNDFVKNSRKINDSALISSASTVAQKLKKIITNIMLSEKNDLAWMKTNYKTGTFEKELR